MYTHFKCAWFTDDKDGRVVYRVSDRYLAGVGKAARLWKLPLSNVHVFKNAELTGARHLVLDSKPNA